MALVMLLKLGDCDFRSAAMVAGPLVVLVKLCVVVGV